MAEIARIVIKSSLEYWWVDEAFNDRVIITEESFSYEYFTYMESDYMESEIKPKRKWSYKVTRPVFKYKC